MNLSLWEGHSAEEKFGLLTEMGAAVRSGIMPKPQYTLIHPGAKLSADEVQQLYIWTRAERQRLRHESEEMKSRRSREETAGAP